MDFLWIQVTGDGSLPASTSPRSAGERSDFNVHEGPELLCQLSIENNQGP